MAADCISARLRRIFFRARGLQVVGGEYLEDVDPDLTYKLVDGHPPVRAHCLKPDGTALTIDRLVLTPPFEVARGYGTDNETGIRSTAFHFDGDRTERSL